MLGKVLQGGGGWSRSISKLAQVQVQGPYLQGDLRARAMSSSSYKQPAFKLVHLDEMPVPMGSWQADYKVKNKRYNKLITFGIVYFLITLLVIVRSNIIFFNFRIPPLEEEEGDEDGACTPPPPPKC
jgi:hypothetical protein